MRARTTAAVLVAVTALVAGYLAWRAVELLRTGRLDGQLLGVGVLLLVAVGAALLWGEVRFGLDTQRLAQRLAEQDALPQVPADADRLPSGRLTRDAADAVFDDQRAQVEAAPRDWRAWFALAAAYGEARDPARGRRAMRTAIRLEREQRSGSAGSGSPPAA